MKLVTIYRHTNGTGLRSHRLLRDLCAVATCGALAVVMRCALAMDPNPWCKHVFVEMCALRTIINIHVYAFCIVHHSSMCTCVPVTCGIPIASPEYLAPISKGPIRAFMRHVEPPVGDTPKII